jgi:hypothetical protein
MNILNNGRSGLAGGCVGGMKTLIALTSSHANERHQFGQPIGSFGLVKQKIGYMVADCYATESIVQVVAALADRQYDDFSLEAAITKVYASEALWRAADQALQIAGGTGFMREYPYERVLRDCRINRIYEGTNDILRLYIALTALNDVGQRLKELAGSLRGIFDDPIKGFGLLYDYAKQRTTWATGLPVLNPRMTKAHVALRAEAEIFEDAARDLAAMTDRLLRKHGKNIIGKQFATSRLANVMIDLFALACVISRVTAAIENKGVDNAGEEIAIAKILAGQVRFRARRCFRRIDDNDDELIKGLFSCQGRIHPALTQSAILGSGLLYFTSMYTRMLLSMTPSSALAAFPSSEFSIASNAAMSLTAIKRPVWSGFSAFWKTRTLATPCWAKRSCRLFSPCQAASQ